MNSNKNILIYIILLIIIIFLLIFNANYQAKIYSEELTGVDITQMKAEYKTTKNEYIVEKGKQLIIPVEIINTGSMTWLAHSEKPINLSYHIYNDKKEEYEYDGQRTTLPITLRPNESIIIQAEVQAPSEEGLYYIEFDMVYEGVAWFSERGSKTESIQLIVQ